ncbi:MAG: 2-C-methyl-D-erythritol 2,4-cyclodiphosphate synthase [Verrucomicrobiota bacterium]
MSFRVGIGYDVHQLVEGRPLFLGGVEIPHDRGLDGHSDADALLHAIADAILGAIGEGDIGQHFPNTDPQWKDVRSTVLLEHIAKVLAERGARLENVDATLIAEAPKIGPHLPAMKEAIAAALGITTAQVGIKATTNETMGFVGRREGIAAMAVAAVEL